MSAKVKDAKRMELICEFIKTGKQPDGFKITETKAGKYRLERAKDGKEALEAKRKRLQKSIDDIDEELKKFNQEEPSPKTQAPEIQDLGPENKQ